MDLTPPTRQSLLSRLRSWDNQDSWHEFFELYSRLIYGVARRSGLAESEAEEVVQETVIAVAKEMPGFKYDRLKGSFKGWLLVITRRRIADQLRRRYRQVGPGLADIEDPQVAAELARVTDGSELESVWDKAEEKLQPMNPDNWTALDKAIDRALAKVRSGQPDQKECVSALKTLITKLSSVGKPR